MQLDRSRVLQGASMVFAVVVLLYYW